MALVAAKPLPLTWRVAAGVPVDGLRLVICGTVEKVLVEVVLADASLRAMVCEPPVLVGMVKLQADTAPVALAVQPAMVENEPLSTEDWMVALLAAKPSPLTCSVAPMT